MPSGGSDRETREQLRQARELLLPWRDWMIRSLGLTEDRANVSVALLVRTIWEHPGEAGENPDPISGLYYAKSRPAYSQLKSSIKRYYTWQLTRRDSTEPEKTWARRQLGILATSAKFDNGLSVRLVTTKKNAIEPEPIEVLERLLSELPAWYKKYRARWPWAAALGGIILKIGPYIRSELVYLRREDLVLARADGKRSGVFKMWAVTKRKSTNRSIPIGLVWAEAETLCRWPWEWTTVSDLITPNPDSYHPVGSASRLLERSLSRFQTDVLGRTCNAHALRLASWAWMFRQLKGDWITLARITGVSDSKLREMPSLLEISDQSTT